MPGVATELMLGLAELGHEIDCYLSGRERDIPDRLAKAERVSFHWGTRRVALEPVVQPHASSGASFLAF